MVDFTDVIKKTPIPPVISERTGSTLEGSKARHSTCHHGAGGHQWVLAQQASKRNSASICTEEPENNYLIQGKAFSQVSPLWLAKRIKTNEAIRERITKRQAIAAAEKYKNSNITSHKLITEPTLQGTAEDSARQAIILIRAKKTSTMATEQEEPIKISVED